MSVSKELKQIAYTARGAFGGEPKVIKYWDNNHESSVDILISEGSPVTGVNSYSTIGLSEKGIGLMSEDLPLRIEIVGACDASRPTFANVIATCAFNVINSSFECLPGTIFRSVVRAYEPSSPLAHILFVSPYLWEDRLQTITMDDRRVAWLMVVCFPQVENVEKRCGFLHRHRQHQVRNIKTTPFPTKHVSVGNSHR